MRSQPLLLSLFVVTLVGQTALGANLTTDQAKDHVGENATVCGVVASTHYARSSRGNPTFVNLDKPYPDQPFMILIWGKDLPKFSPKPTTWEGKRVCATGKITSYQDRPEIMAKEPGQITVEDSNPSK